MYIDFGSHSFCSSKDKKKLFYKAAEKQMREIEKEQRREERRDLRRREKKLKRAEEKERRFVLQSWLFQLYAGDQREKKKADEKQTRALPNQVVLEELRKSGGVANHQRH